MNFCSPRQHYEEAYFPDDFFIDSSFSIYEELRQTNDGLVMHYVQILACSQVSSGLLSSKDTPAS
jgi:hypothetical protein